jgi:hypothetical protein
MSDAKKIRQVALFDEKRKTLENLVVLYLTQAMLGLVSPNLRVVAVDVGPERAVVHFAFAEDRPEDREDVEDILADLDALLSNEDLPKDWTIEPAFYIGNADEAWPGRMSDGCSRPSRADSRTEGSSTPPLRRSAESRSPTRRRGRATRS